jgi:hypothetical protein
MKATVRLAIGDLDAHALGIGIFNGERGHLARTMRAGRSRYRFIY